MIIGTIKFYLIFLAIRLAWLKFTDKFPRDSSEWYQELIGVAVVLFILVLMGHCSSELDTRPVDWLDY